MGDLIDGIDRISDLPDFIIHHIMSFITVKEVAKTSVLSKRWNYLRTSFPILDLDQFYFLGRGCSTCDEDDYETNEEICDGRLCECMMNFVKFGNDSLIKFYELRIRMQQFRIFTRLVDFRGLYSILDKWIDLAAVSGVQDLDICIQTNRDKLYILPQNIFSAKSVITLELTGCRLEQPSDTLRFHSLKILTLRYVHMNDQILHKLTSESPLLEKLCIHSCWGIKCFCISKSLKLKVVIICVSLENDLESIKIVVPSLQKFSLSFEDSPTSSCVIDLSGCPHLKNLVLIGVIFKDQEFHDFISKFPLLEYLDVERCCFLGRFMVSSNQLKELLISDCDNLKAIDVDTPNLHFFFYQSNTVPIFSINAPCQWRVELDCGGVDVHWYLNVKEFLRASEQNCDLTIYFKSSWSSFKLEDLRRSSPSLPCGVERLSLYTYVLPSNYAALFDGIFWICYPKYFTITGARESTQKFVKWFCEQLLKDDVNCCDSSYHIKCWRHYLKDCRIVSSGEDDVPFDIHRSSSPSVEFCLEWSFPTDDDLPFSLLKVETSFRSLMHS